MTNPVPLEDMTLRQLRRVASAVGVSRYSRMRKDQLLSSILDKQGPEQTMIEASKYGLQAVSTVDLSLADVDETFSELPSGYGESRIVILPRDPQWAYAYWDITNEHKDELRRQGGQQLALRLFDVTDVDITSQSPHSVQEYGCDEMAREWYLPIPVSDREYLLEIGYRTWDGRWLTLARSASMRVPPVYPSDWVEDHFVTVDWEEMLEGKTVLTLVPPSQKAAEYTSYQAQTEIHNHIFGMAGEVESQRIAGSLYGSMQHSSGPAPHLDTVSSYVFPSGAGLWALPTFSGINMSGVGISSGELAKKPQPRKFWLVADAELIVYGATEPDATVYVDGEPIVLNSDGTFRFQMSFQDGQLKFPIVAVAADGEQNRSVRMDFERCTSDRRTNTKAEAVEEWFAIP
jgi:uncharacterized protein